MSWISRISFATAVSFTVVASVAPKDGRGGTHFCDTLETVLAFASPTLPPLSAVVHSSML
jgi:hypothetical protein